MYQEILNYIDHLTLVKLIMVTMALALYVLKIDKFHSFILTALIIWFVPDIVIWLYKIFAL